MYNPDMTSPLPASRFIQTLSPEPGIVVWYSRISKMADLLFSKATYHNFKFPVNEIFKKNDFTQSFLSDGEILTLNGFRALKKQIEWVCGRYLLKQMTAGCFLKTISPDRITFSYRPEGAPFVDGHPRIPLSLTHSHDYVAAACSTDFETALGLDVEKIAGMPDPWFLKTAFSQKELRHLGNDPARVFRHWTIKEAYLKYIGKGFHENLHRVEVIHDAVFHHGRRADVAVFCRPLDPDYILSLVSGRSLS